MEIPDATHRPKFRTEHLSMKSEDPLFHASLVVAFLAFLSVILFPYSIQAQGYKAKLFGHVNDQAGSSVPGVTLSATRLRSGDTFTAETNAGGDYVLSQLPPGIYRITATRSGFRKFVLAETELQIDQTARLDIELSVGSLSEEVVIQNESPVIDTETPSLGSVISNAEILDIPLNLRNYLSLALLSPGVVPAAAGANPHNINGSRSDYVNYLIDGVPNINRRGNEPVVTPSLEAIQEFKIITNSYSAEYGRLAAGVISVALKTGTDAFRGSIFHFHRNDRLDARSFFDPARLELDRNQFGGTVSGPLRRGSTYFVASYEALRNRQGETRLTRVPTLAERSGVFNNTVRNPFTGQPFAANTITPSLISPVAQALVSLFPAPNRAGVLNYINAATLVDKQHSFLTKIGHRISDKDQLAGKFVFNRGRGVNPFRSTALPGYGSTRSSDKQVWSVVYDRIISDRTVNEVRFGFSRDSFDETSVNTGKNTSLDIGITGVEPGYGLANIVIAGFPELGDATFLPDRWLDKEFSFSNTLSIATGNHYLRIGGDLQHSRFKNLFASFAGGQIAFNGAFTLNPFADLLLGLPIQTQRQVGTNTSRLSSSYYGFFVQDDWRIHRNLTLNLGLRYDVNQPPTEADDRWANFLPDQRRQVPAGTEELPRSLVRTDRNNFSPRIGLAIRPFGDNRTAIRAGYGVFHSFDLQFTQYQIMGASAFPFTRLELFQATAVGNPSLAVPFPNRPGLTPGALSPNGWDFENPTPYMQSWNLTISRELASDLGLEASYVGSKGTNLSSTANINQTIRTPQGNIVPFPGLGRVLFQRLGANSSYNSLQVSVHKRMRNGLAFRSSFTWSKSIDNASFGSPGRLPQDPNNLEAERGLSEFDRRRVWNSDFIYELPFGNGRRFGSGSRVVETLFGGWQISGLIQLSDGRPFTPVASRANTQAGFASRPDRIASGHLESRSVERYFDPAAFTVVPSNAFRFGNSGRNILIGPGSVVIDAALFKHFAMPWEAHMLQLRLEAFNLPNRANFGQPDARIDQPTAGAISSAGPGRQIQLGIKYIF